MGLCPPFLRAENPTIAVELGLEFIAATLVATFQQLVSTTKQPINASSLSGCIGRKAATNP